MVYVSKKLLHAHSEGDWRGVLKWEMYCDELLAMMPVELRASLLEIYIRANRNGARSTSGRRYFVAAISLLQQSIVILNELQRFRDKSVHLCLLGEICTSLDGHEKAKTWYQQARDVGAEHGFFSAECRACLGLARVAIYEKHYEEATDLLRNAVAAAPLVEDTSSAAHHELNTLRELIDLLFFLGKIDEVDPMVLRFIVLIDSTPSTGPEDLGLTPMKLHGPLFMARLHQARDRPDDVEREVRRFLDLIHKNEEVIHEWLPTCINIVKQAGEVLHIFHTETGNTELVELINDVKQKHSICLRVSHPVGNMDAL
jgi:tetratricopeptide (TPR) repeat protein